MEQLGGGRGAQDPGGSEKPSLTFRSGFALSLPLFRNGGADLNSLPAICASRNGDMETLDLLAAGGGAHFEFEMIVSGRIRFGPIERDQSGKFSCQALLDVSGFERCAAYGDAAVFGRNGEPDRWQRTGGAIGSHAGVDADAHVAPERRLDVAIDRIALRVTIARAGAQPKAQHER